MKHSGTADQTPRNHAVQGAYRSRTGGAFRKRRRRLIAATSMYCTVGRREQVRGIEAILRDAGA